MSTTGIPLEEGFTITAHKGFRICFSNGYAVSVQFGPGNYCEVRATSYTRFRKPEEELKKQGYYHGGKTAEVAVFDPFDKFLQLGSDTVKGWVSPEDVATLLKAVSELPKDLSHEAASDRIGKVLRCD
jgi:hypothetical protein